MARPRLLPAVVRSLLGRPSTVQYPYVKTEVEAAYRGRHYADLKKCTGCSLCAIECPADAIAMTQIPAHLEAPKSNPRRVYPKIDYGRCVFCYRCVTVCPFDAYVTTNFYGMAGPRENTSEQLSLGTLERVV
ncbi:4Fe-4S binding protein [Thermogladius sp.]|uniref:4Fe-4S binding protein n=1 Tax=Thermogladius sp. TaxID=2023064 RepID=UPI003D13CB07